MDLSRPLTENHEICTHVWCGSSLKTYFQKFFAPPLNNLAGKTSNFADRRQSEARNFETAQYIDEQKLQLSSTINALQNATKLESLTYGVLTLRVGEK